MADAPDELQAEIHALLKRSMPDVVREIAAFWLKRFQEDMHLILRWFEQDLCLGVEEYEMDEGPLRQALSAQRETLFHEARVRLRDRLHRLFAWARESRRM